MDSKYSLAFRDIYNFLFFDDKGQAKAGRLKLQFTKYRQNGKEVIQTITRPMLPTTLLKALTIEAERFFDAEAKYTIVIQHEHNIKDAPSVVAIHAASLKANMQVGDLFKLGRSLYREGFDPKQFSSIITNLPKLDAWLFNRQAKSHEKDNGPTEQLGINNQGHRIAKINYRGNWYTIQEKNQGNFSITNVRDKTIKTNTPAGRGILKAYRRLLAQHLPAPIPT